MILEDFDPWNLPEDLASLVEAASKAVSTVASKVALATKALKTTAATFIKATRNIMQEEDSEENSNEEDILPPPPPPLLMMTFSRKINVTDIVPFNSTLADLNMFDNLIK